MRSGVMKRTACLGLLLAATAMAADDAGRCPALAPDSGFEWTASQGPDFDVCYAHPPDTDNALFGLYIGYAASFRGRTDTPGEPGIVAGRDVRWFPHTGKDGDFPFGQETLLELDQGPDRGTLQVHAWIVAQTREEQSRAKAALRAMALPR